MKPPVGRSSWLGLPFSFPFRRVVLTGLSALFLSIALPAVSAPPLQNLDRTGLALQGYDPVSFFSEGKPGKGSPAHTAVVDGATYRFATAERKAQFEKAPAQYLPQFGGYCAYGVSRGRLVEVDVNAFQIVQGRLLLQYSKGIRDKFNQDTASNLAQADKYWPGLVKENAKEGGKP
jgi:YHS domain-containing protein